MAGGYGDINLTAPLISKYQRQYEFSTSVVITAAEAVAGKTIFARFAPL
jgi:hypothetical protein